MGPWGPAGAIHAKGIPHSGYQQVQNILPQPKLVRTDNFMVAGEGDLPSWLSWGNLHHEGDLIIRVAWLSERGLDCERARLLLFSCVSVKALSVPLFVQ